MPRTQASPRNGRPPERVTSRAFPGGEAVLLGGGPGDGGLLTVRGATYLRTCDVVIARTSAFPEELRTHLRPRARVEQVGPRDSRRSRGGYEPDPTLVEAIVARLASHARAGRRVVYWTPGDPFLDDQGYEIVARAAEKGLAVIVVPGVARLTAAPTLAGIPLLLPGTSGEFTLLLPPRDWRAGGRRRFLERVRQGYDSGRTLLVPVRSEDAPSLLAAMVRSVPRTVNAALIGEPGTDRGWVLRASLRLMALETPRRTLHGDLLLVVGPVAGYGIRAKDAH